MMKQGMLRAGALILALLLFTLSLVSCASAGEPLLTLEADGKSYTYSVNLYELYLSAIKGYHIASGKTSNGESAASDKYWSTIDMIDGKLQTVNEHCLAEALKECKYALTGLYLFDKYVLALSDAEKKKIEDDLNELVLTDGEGSKSALNAILASYSVNYDMMREHYTNKLKISAVQNYLYSLLGDNVKAEYLEENYVHFQQIFLADYNYVYVTDDRGDVIYYDENNEPLYRETAYRETKNGKTVYYTDDTYTHLSYDEENGLPSPKINASGSAYETTPKTPEELAALEERANQLKTLLDGASAEEFEKAVAKESDDPTAVQTYTDGYYLKRNTATDEEWGDAYTLILEALEEMEIGEVALVETLSGYHIIKKYENTKKAYEKSENSVWFEDFAKGLAEQIYRAECEQYLSSIKIDEALLANAKDMKQVSPNYFYY